MEIHHDLDLLAHGLAQRLHQLGHMVDAAQRGRVMRVGDEHDLEGAVALVDDLEGLVDQRLGLHGLIDRAHVAEAEMGIDRHAIAGLAAEEPPDRHAQILAQDIPERHLDAGDGGGADDPHAPEAMLVHHPISLLDVARIAADEERGQILHGPDDGARLPFQGGLAPAVEPRLVGLDLDEDPIAHLGIDDGGLDGGDFHVPAWS